MARRPVHFLAVAVLTAGFAVLALPLAAQDDSSLFFDTVDVHVVNVEVVVTDKDGKPAVGLARDDFEVYEDGKRVEVANFFAVEGRRTVLAGAAAYIGVMKALPFV